jgi:2'-5' RNA ligase
MRRIVKPLSSLILLVGFISGCIQSAKKTYSSGNNDKVVLIDPSIYKKVTFVDNSKNPMPYLVMNVNHEPFAAIRKYIESEDKVTLAHRGEAHITVITPPEFDQLKSALPIELTNEVAILNRIQEMPYEIICVGKGTKNEDGKKLITYFIVVDAPELVSLRHTIATLYKSRGGGPTEFKPEEFYPHITIGFEGRDLHIQDGLIKDKRSCVMDTGK